ncbi:MAG: replicative DNA helicase [Bacteroidales bacterium]|nr:replicative DNA helicase [Candidatus Colimorpha pelethequi]
MRKFATMETVPMPVAKRKDRMSYANAFDLNGKVPPQALDLEEAVLGALMLDQIALSNTIETLHVEFFYKPEHQSIFRAIFKLFEQSQPVDMMTVIDRLRQDGELEAAGGSYYVAQLTNKVVSAAHIEYYVRVLSEKFIERELIRISTETITSAYDDTTDVVDLLDKTEQRLMDINDKNFRADYHDMRSLVGQATEQIKASQENKGNCAGLPTGFLELDRTTAGFQPGTLIILAARPAMGKTAFALTMARNIAVDFKKPIAFFSLEMTAVELTMRLISSEAEIPGEDLKKGDRIQPWQMEQILTKTQTLNEAPIYIDDTPGLTIFELRAKCRRLKQKYDIQMVFIDYLQLMTAGGDSKNGNREQEISTISRQLKALSKELSIPVLALSQLSRAVETRGGSKKPQLSDLRESGAIEQDADIVMFIYRPDYYGIDSDERGSTQGMADIILAKHRSGSTGEVRLKFVNKYVRFENPDYVPVNQFAGMSASEGFDAQSNTIVVDSKMNQQDGGEIPPSLPPDTEVPF